MISKMYTVFDSAAGAYLPPFYQPSRGAAVRVFRDTANDENSMIGKHPGDYTLFEIGEYDDQTGRVEMAHA